MNQLIKKIIARQNDNLHNPGVTIAFLGDSVTQGCFEVYRKAENAIETVFDKRSAYHAYLSEIFTVLCPNVPVNIINAGISGDNAPHGFERLKEDVLVHKPDLIVVCFGLNDCSQGLDGVGKYIQALTNIFNAVKDAGCEIIFMTPNMMCTNVSCHIIDEFIKGIAEASAIRQNEGVLDAYIDAARALCKEKDVPVCDCYAKWKRLEEIGINVTELLSNHINHPSREMNWLFAYSLAETILGI